MATTLLHTESPTAPSSDRLPGQPGHQQTASIPLPRHGSPQGIPVPPDHRSEQARRRSEQEQAAIDIAAGW